MTCTVIYMGESARPKYRQVADELRRRINAGAMPPGSALPSEPALIAEFGVSRTSIREALSLLRSEGLIYTEMGRATFVRARMPVRRISADRYRIEVKQFGGDSEPATSFTHDQGINWSDYQLDKDFREVPATPRLAEMLAVPLGAVLLERRFVFRALGVPQQMSTSYYPLDMVAGTPVADPDREPWPGGNISQLATLGITVTTVTEEVGARMPLEEETETLRIPSGVPVLTITRRMLAGTRPVEAAVDIVIPADRAVLDYRIDLTD